LVVTVISAVREPMGLEAAEAAQEAALKWLFAEMILQTSAPAEAAVVAVAVGRPAERTVKLAAAPSVCL